MTVGGAGDIEERGAVEDLGETHSGNEMASGNEAGISVSFLDYCILGGGGRTTHLKSITGSSEVMGIL